MQISRRQLLVVASTATFVGFSGFSLQALAAELTLPSVGADKKFSAVPVPADPKRLPQRPHQSGRSDPQSALAHSTSCRLQAR